MGTIITASIHVAQDSNVRVSVEKLDSNNNKYAVLSIGNATIFINSREKAVEISCLLEQATQKWEDEDKSN